MQYIFGAFIKISTTKWKNDLNLRFKERYKCVTDLGFPGAVVLLGRDPESQGAVRSQGQTGRGRRRAQGSTIPRALARACTGVCRPPGAGIGRPRGWSRPGRRAGRGRPARRAPPARSRLRAQTAHQGRPAQTGAALAARGRRRPRRLPASMRPTGRPGWTRAGSNRAPRVGYNLKHTPKTTTQSIFRFWNEDINILFANEHK